MNILTAQEKRAYNRAVSHIIGMLERDIKNYDMDITVDTRKYLAELVEDLRSLQAQ